MQERRAIISNGIRHSRWAQPSRLCDGSRSGKDYEITALDVWTASHAACKAAEILGQVTEIQMIIHKLVATAQPDSFVCQVLGREPGLN